MELKNKPKKNNSLYQHNKNVKLNRKLDLRTKYYQGLKIENEIFIEKYQQEKVQEIEEYYREDSKEYLKVLNSENKNEEKYKEALEEYELKKYWEKRKYQTKLKRRNSPDFENLMAEFISREDELKNEFLEEINYKYPNIPYTKDEIAEANAAILRLKTKKEARLNKLQARLESLQKKISKANQSISLRLKKYEELTNSLNEQIQLFNENLIVEEKQEIVFLEEEKQKENLNSKQREKIENRINYLQSKIAMTEDEDLELIITNLKMYFGGIKAVNDISFKIHKGQIFGLIGPNGAGKTTVFNCITQFYKATSGVILYRNKENNLVDLNKLAPHEIINEGIARSFQNVELIWELSVLDNLLVAAHSLLLTNYFDHMVHSQKAKREEEILKTKATKILEDLNILEYANRFPYGLPYGILKKVELARTLMTEPSMIILDEPAAGLNEMETIELAKIIKEINQEYGITIFLVEHDMSLVMSICDPVLAISFGKELCLGTPKEIQNDEKVRIAYLGEDD